MFEGCLRSHCKALCITMKAEERIPFPISYGFFTEKNQGNKIRISTVSMVLFWENLVPPGLRELHSLLFGFICLLPRIVSTTLPAIFTASQLVLSVQYVMWSKERRGIETYLSKGIWKNSNVDAPGTNYTSKSRTEDQSSTSQNERDFYMPVVNMNKIRRRWPATTPKHTTMTYFYLLPKATPRFCRRPRNQLTFHFSAGHRRHLSVTADGGEGGEMNRSSKRSMDPRQRTLHHSLGPPHRWAAAKCRRLVRTQRSLWASRQMKTKDAASQWLGVRWRGSKSLTGRPVKAFFRTPHENGPTWWRPATEGSERVVGSSHQSLGTVWCIAAEDKWSWCLTSTLDLWCPRTKILRMILFFSFLLKPTFDWLRPKG